MHKLLTEWPHTSATLCQPQLNFELVTDELAIQAISLIHGKEKRDIP